jgi:GNAT superfamily N-acetyltransferase
MSYEFVAIDRNNIAIKEIAELLRLVFPKAAKYSDAFIEWQYLKNPNGKIRGYNAFYDGKLVAHYAMMPIVADVFGKAERGLLSLNTATHPDHQGKKLFTALADMSYKAATEEGYGFVAGVANANSTPGFVNKLGFQLVGPLEAKLGFGKISYEKATKEFDFAKRWNSSLPWRLTNPELKYKIKDNKVYSATDKFGIEAILLDVSGLYPLPDDLDVSDVLPLHDNAISSGFRPIKLWIGIDDRINWNKSFYFNVPKSMRPSPLNFIFKDLTLANRKLELNKVRFNALDFDAY